MVLSQEVRWWESAGVPIKKLGTRCILFKRGKRLCKFFAQSFLCKKHDHAHHLLETTHEVGTPGPPVTPPFPR